MPERERERERETKTCLWYQICGWKWRYIFISWWFSAWNRWRFPPITKHLYVLFQIRNTWYVQSYANVKLCAPQPADHRKHNADRVWMEVTVINKRRNSQCCRLCLFSCGLTSLAWLEIFEEKKKKIPFLKMHPDRLPFACFWQQTTKIFINRKLCGHFPSYNKTGGEEPKQWWPLANMVY